MLFYIVGGFLSGGIETALYALGFCLLPFFAIWFSQPMGEWKGNRLSAPSFTSSSPGCLINLLGWVILFAPFIAYFIVEYGV